MLTAYSLDNFQRIWVNYRNDLIECGNLNFVPCIKIFKPLKFVELHIVGGKVGNFMKNMS